jgi:hypothetical protein
MISEQDLVRDALLLIASHVDFTLAAIRPDDSRVEVLLKVDLRDLDNDKLWSWIERGIFVLLNLDSSTEGASL